MVMEPFEPAQFVVRCGNQDQLCSDQTLAARRFKAAAISTARAVGKRPAIMRRCASSERDRTPQCEENGTKNPAINGCRKPCR